MISSIITYNYYQNNKSIATRTRFDCSKTSQIAFAPRTNLNRRSRSRKENQLYLIYIVSAAARSRHAILDRGSRSRSRKGNRTLTIDLLPKTIKFRLKQYATKTNEAAGTSQRVRASGRCAFCERAKDRKTTKVCTNYARLICRDHIIETCPDCFIDM